MQKQPKTRSAVAVAAFQRRSSSMDKRGKGRTYREQDSRQCVKSDLRRGEW